MRSTILLVVLAAACAGEPVEGADATSSSETTGTSSTTAPMTTSTTSMTTSATAETTETGETSTSDPTTADESSSTEAPPSACDFETEVDATIEDAKDVIDCGQLTLADPLAAWDEGRTCARDAALDQSAFELSWQTDAGGTLHDLAITSMGMGTPILHLVDDAAVGTSSISLFMCTGTYTPPDCQIAVGDPCLACLEPSKPAELCD